MPEIKPFWIMQAESFYFAQNTTRLRRMAHAMWEEDGYKFEPEAYLSYRVRADVRDAIDKVVMC